MTEKRKITKPKEMERIPVKFYSHKYILENEVTVNPMGEIAGFQMRPGGFVVRRYVWRYLQEKPFKREKFHTPPMLLWLSLRQSSIGGFKAYSPGVHSR